MHETSFDWFAREEESYCHRQKAVHGTFVHRIRFTVVRILDDPNPHRDCRRGICLKIESFGILGLAQ